jgi:hypothetical protein
MNVKLGHGALSLELKVQYEFNPPTLMNISIDE